MHITNKKQGKKKTKIASVVPLKIGRPVSMQQKGGRRGGEDERRIYLIQDKGFR